MATLVSLVGGPRDGTTESVPDPWPRSQIIVQSGGSGSYTYWVREGTTTADYRTSADIPPDTDVFSESAGPPGDPGPEGPPGPTGPQGAAGPSLAWRGAWSSAYVYGQWETVIYQGSTYFVHSATASPAGTLPTNTTYWTKLATGWTWRGVWDAATAYSPGDVVHSAGAAYVALNAVTSATAPGSDTTNWGQVAAAGATGAAGVTGPAGPRGLTWRGAWASTAAYAVDDAVTYAGASYRRRVAGTTATAPDGDAANWELLAAKGNAGAGGHTIEDELTALAARLKLSFQGAGVTATDDAAADRTIVTIPGGGGGGGSSVAAVHDDDFSTDRLAEYVADQSTSLVGLSVAGGVLRTADANDHSFHHATLSVIDAKHMLKVIPGSSAGFLHYLCAKFVNADNFLFMQAHDAAGAFYNCYQRVATTYTSLGQINMPSSSGGAPHWIVMRHNGNHVAFETWRTNPMYGNGEPIGKLDAVLTGTAATALGAGVSAPPGLRLHGMNANNWALDDWIVVAGVDRTAF